MSAIIVPSAAEATRELCTRRLRYFVEEGWHVLEPSTPYVHGRHIDAICDHLEAVAGGDLTARAREHGNALHWRRIHQLLINVPPGHAKSMLVAVFWPAWVWLKRPSWRALFASYAEDLSIRDSVRCRTLIESAWYQDTFRPAWKLKGDQNVKGHFENTETGFRVALGVGGKGTGFRGDAIVVDDALNAKDTHSDVARKKMAFWWDHAFANRLNDLQTGARVIIGQRLHEEDLPGILLDREAASWAHLCLPTEYEPELAKTTPLGWRDWRTTPGELLFPQRFPREVIEEERTRLLETGFAGQHQQRPAPKGGSMFREEDFEIITVLPPDIVGWVRAWDVAGTHKAGCYTVGTLMAMTARKTFIVVDIVRGQWGEAEVSERILQTARLDGTHVPIAEEQEPGSAGKAVIEARRRLLVGYTYAGYPASGDKVQRAGPMAAQAQGRRIALYRPPGVEASAHWIRKWIDELKVFPNGKYKDQVDSASLAFSRLALGPTGFRVQKLHGH